MNIQEKRKNLKKVVLKKLNADLERVADLAENKLSNVIEGSNFEVPLLENFEDAEVLKWYRINIENGKSGDGSAYHIYIKKGSCDRNAPLCIFFSGGGVAWDKWMAERPVSSGKIVSNEPNYYWNNLRPVTQLMNIGIGITDLREKGNPFYKWNFVVITYSTGDFHIGQNEYTYLSGEEEKTVYFHGYINYTEAMKVSKEFFDNPEKMLIAGDSAGGFAVSLLSDEILEKWYPGCENVTLYSDSSELCNEDWHDIAQKVWKAPKRCYEPLVSSNLVVDGYANLYKKYGDKIKYLYSGSPNDYLLSSFRNDVINHKYKTDKDIQADYEIEFHSMLEQLKEINPKFGIYVYNWKNRVHSGGGTIHTAVRTLYFYVSKRGGIALKDWLIEATKY